MEDRLKYLLSVVIDLVKFAETKNAALLVVPSGLVLMLIDHFPDRTIPPMSEYVFGWVESLSGVQIMEANTAKNS